MEWTEKHDVFLCREILVVELFKSKKKTHRAELWDKIAQNLCEYSDPKFTVTKRAVRDRYGVISSKYKKKMRDEEKASGIEVGEQSELDVLLEEVVERENQAEDECNEGKKKVEAEKAKAADVRLTAMESLGKTKKREVFDSGKEPAAKKKSRRSGSDAVEFLKEKSEQEIKLKQQEIELRKQQQQMESEKNSSDMKRHESMMEMMSRQQQQMLQQMQQQQLMMAQQTELFAGLVGKLIPK